MSCYCNFDFTWTLLKEKTVTAKKPHRCYECGRVIKPGERYQSLFGVGGGTAYNMPTCLQCQALRDYVESNVPCACLGNGTLLDDAHETVRNIADSADIVGSGFVFGYLRRRVAIRRARMESR